MERTINLKIPFDERIVETIRLYNTACNIALKTGFKRKTFNKTKLHNATYRKIMRLHPELNSSYVCASRDQASDMLKREKLKRLPVKKQHSSIRLNHNTFTPFLDSAIISLSTLKGRIKVPIKIPQCYVKYATGKITSATLGIKGGNIFLHLISQLETPTKRTPNKVLGIDRGVINPVVTSDNQFFNSRILRRIKGRYQWLKARLQSKGTPSAMRHLKRLSGRERRFVRDMNHCLSKRIAEGEADTFVLEQLQIKRKKEQGRKFNTLLGGWSYRQFQNFLEYKAENLGKNIIYVNPKHTSQTCSVCGHVEKANRNGVLFKCKKCSFSLNADLNASRNIAQLGNALLGRLHVNQPIVATYHR